MKLIKPTTLLLAALLASSAYAADQTNAVVKIFVTAKPQSYYQPWLRHYTRSITGSGAIISGKRILTNAHVVSGQTFIQVKKNGDSKKYTAKLIAVQDQCDLALLTVEDPKFFEDTTSLKLGSLPKLQDTVTVLGFPEGGDKLSLTEGVVSRVEVTDYAQSERHLLTVQIDAAINAGNSGGPIVLDGSLLGIAMQGLGDSQNIGYMIPTPIIKHFIKDLKDGTINGFPIVGVSINLTENDSMRVHYNIQDEKGGILVAGIQPFSPAEETLKIGDVILSVDGHEVGSDGTYNFRANERLVVLNLFSSKQIGETVTMKVMREGKIVSLAMLLKKFTPLVPLLTHFKKPSYYIYGGVVFSIFGNDLLSEWGDDWRVDASAHMLAYSRVSELSRINRHKEKVILISVLPHQVNVGYHNLEEAFVSSVNGVDVKSFKQFVQLIRSSQSKEPRTIIKTDDDIILVIDNDDIDNVDAEIIERYGIPARYSKDVEMWIGE